MQLYYFNPLHPTSIVLFTLLRLSHNYMVQITICHALCVQWKDLVYPNVAMLNADFSDKRKDVPLKESPFCFWAHESWLFTAMWFSLVDDG